MESELELEISNSCMNLDEPAVKHMAAIGIILRSLTLDFLRGLAAMEGWDLDGSLQRKSDITDFLYTKI
jgi:hypothetical protein